MNLYNVPRLFQAMTLTAEDNGITIVPPYKIHEDWADKLERINAALETLTQAEFEEFCCGDSDTINKTPDLKLADEFLGMWFEIWMIDQWKAQKGIE